MIDFNRLLFSIKSRFLYSVLQNILADLKYSGGRGLDATIEKLKNDLETNFDNNFFDKLQNSYFEHLLCGDKYVYFYTLETEVFEKIYQYFKNFEIKESIFSTNFPYILYNEEIKQEFENIPFVSKIYEADNQLYIIISTIRSIDEKSEINKDFVTLLDSNNYISFYGIKRHKKQFFDVIVLNKENLTIEYRIDFVDNYQANNWFETIKQYFNSFFSHIALRELNNELNLYPILLKIYEDQSGQICELKFTTDDDIIKGLKSRLKKEDIRLDKYHSAGTLAVPKISPYRIGIIWEFNNNKLELLVPGNFKLLSSTSPIINEVLITKCRNTTDYSFVINKIFSYLK